MILSKKTAWLLHDLAGMRLDSNGSRSCLEPRCMYIQDVIDLQAHRFFMSDGEHFITCTIRGTAFASCMGKYDLASMELKGMLIQTTEYRFVIRGGFRLELVIFSCICVGEGSLLGETIDINEIACVGQRPNSIGPYQVDFEKVGSVLSCPLFCYVKEKLAEECDLGTDGLCVVEQAVNDKPKPPAPPENDETFALFQGSIQNKLSHLMHGNEACKIKEKNVPKEQDLNTSQSLSKCQSFSMDAEMCGLSLEDIDIHINFDDESKLSIFFFNSENDSPILRQIECSEPAAAKPPYGQNPAILDWVPPESAAFSIGPATLDAICKNSSDLGIEEAILDGLASDELVVPCNQEALARSLSQTQTCIFDIASITTNNEKEQSRPRAVITLQQRSRKIEIRLPRRPPLLSFTPCEDLPLNQLVDDKFFIMNNMYMNIAEIETNSIQDASIIGNNDEDILHINKSDSVFIDEVQTQYTHAPNMHSSSASYGTISSSLDMLGESTRVTICDVSHMDISAWLDEEPGRLQEEKPVIIKLCKGPYEPADDLAARNAVIAGRRKPSTCKATHLSSLTAYYASGVRAKMFFTRSRGGALVFQPEKNRNKSILNSKHLSTRYIRPNRSDVSFIRRGTGNTIFRGLKTPSIRFIRNSSHRSAKAMLSRLIPSLHFVTGDIKCQLRRVSGRPRAYLLL